MALTLIIVGGTGTWGKRDTVDGAEASGLGGDPGES